MTHIPHVLTVDELTVHLYNDTVIPYNFGKKGVSYCYDRYNSVVVITDDKGAQLVRHEDVLDVQAVKRRPAPATAG